MTPECKHRWEPYTRWKARCRTCKRAVPWANLLREAAAAHRAAAKRSLTLTDAEAELLRLVLEQIRNAAADNVQLSILFDHFTLGGGAHLSFSHSSAGFSCTIEGDFKKKRAPHARRTRSRR